MLTTVSTGIFEGMQAKPIGLYGVRGFYAPRDAQAAIHAPNRLSERKKYQRNAKVG